MASRKPAHYAGAQLVSFLELHFLEAPQALEVVTAMAVGVNRKAGFALNCIVEGVPLNTVVAVVST